MGLAKIDSSPPHRPSAFWRWALAAIASIGGSLVADALLVKIGTAAFPSTEGYVHFRLSDYGKLTVIGVAIACLAWPIVVAFCSQPKWLFFRLAILVTLVLFLPDVWILMHGAPREAVAVLMAMHVAIAVVTYKALVHIAPPRRHAAHRPAHVVATRADLDDGKHRSSRPSPALREIPEQ